MDARDPNSTFELFQNVVFAFHGRQVISGRFQFDGSYIAIDDVLCTVYSS